MASIRRGWLGDVEVRSVQTGHDAVGVVLHPGPQVLPAGDPPRRVGLERGDSLLDGAAGHDLPGFPCHLGLDPSHLRPAPCVRLIQVDGGAEEAA
jgi:hypothetical protein